MNGKAIQATTADNTRRYSCHWERRLTNVEMSADYKFEGWMGEDERSAEGNMVWQEYEPKKWEETDVDIRVTHCGICGSDIHVLRSGWVS